MLRPMFLSLDWGLGCEPDLGFRDPEAKIAVASNSFLETQTVSSSKCPIPYTLNPKPYMTNPESKAHKGHGRCGKQQQKARPYKASPSGGAGCHEEDSSRQEEDGRLMQKRALNPKIDPQHRRIP